MRRRSFGFASLAALMLAASLCAQIAAPSPGFVRYDNRLAIGSLLGVAGGFVLGPAELGAAEAASFGDKAALIASNGVLKLVRKDGKLLAASPYGGAAPVLSVSDGPQSAVAWLPAAHSLLTFNDHEFVTSAIAEGALPGTVTSITLVSPEWASLLLSQADGAVSQTLVALPDGDVRSIDLLPGINGPAYRFGNTLIWRDGDGLETEEIVKGERHTLAAAPEGSFTAERMSGLWVHLFFAKSNTHWALQFGKDEPVLSRLPVPAATREVRP